MSIKRSCIFYKEQSTFDKQCQYYSYCNNKKQLTVSITKVYQNVNQLYKSVKVVHMV